MSKALRQWLERRLRNPRLVKLAAKLGRERAALKRAPEAKANLTRQLLDPDLLERMLR